MKSPWVIRLEQEIENSDSAISQHLTSMLSGIKKYSLENILKNAVSHKQYDIYHSTTIEGYTITPQEVEAVLLGAGPSGKLSSEKLRNKMAIIGHAQAFEYIIAKIKEDYDKPEISQDLIAEIYFRLFNPSVDAGIIDRFDLIGFRNVRVYIRNSRYVPPSFEKVVDLMKSFLCWINRIKNPIIKSVLAHYFFVTIHPYPDGNGRCGRLLMNYLLGASGYNWCTITKDERDRYFQILQEGQINSDIIPFANFILSLLSIGVSLDQKS